MTQKTGGQSKRRPTMMDVAALAGVSQATVSLVLNGSQGVKLAEATKERVRDAARQLNYQFVRRQVPSNNLSPSLIVFLADELTTDPWMALAFEGVRDKALEMGVGAVLTMDHGTRSADDLSVLTSFQNAPVIGYIFGTTLTRKIRVPAELASERLVLLNCYDEARRYPSVVPGDVVGGRAATEHLIAAGHKRIGFINGQAEIDASRDRLRGYKQALASGDIPFDPALVKPGNWEISAGYRLAHELMGLEDPPDAIFCANDLMAAGCMDALHELGKAIPDDVSVIGFDNRDVAQNTRPQLTTLTLPHYEMGEIAAELLLDSAGGLNPRQSRLKVECPLVERDSVRKPAD